MLSKDPLAFLDGSALEQYSWSEIQVGCVYSDACAISAFCNIYLARDAVSGKYSFKLGEYVPREGASNILVILVDVTPSVTVYFLLSCLLRKLMDKFQIPVAGITAYSKESTDNLDTNILLEYVTGERTHENNHDDSQLGI